MTDLIKKYKADIALFLKEFSKMPYWKTVMLIVLLWGIVFLWRMPEIIQAFTDYQQMTHSRTQEIGTL